MYVVKDCRYIVSVGPCIIKGFNKNSFYVIKTNEYKNWDVETVAAVIKNFTLAIIEGKLEATVKNKEKEYTINKNTIETLLFDTLSNNIPTIDVTQQVFKTLTDPDDGVKRVKIIEDGDLSIFVKYGENFRKTFSRFRGTGMLINRTEESFPHLCIVIVVNDVGNNELSKLLREAEPPQHTEWKGKNVKNNQRLRDKVNRNLRKIRDEVQKVMMSYMRPPEMPKVIDAGTGEYFQGEADNFNIGESKDGLKVDLKIKDIRNTAGKILFDRQRLKDQSVLGETAIGNPIEGYVVHAGTRKRRHRRRVRIRQVNTEGETGNATRGVAPTGQGKVRIQNLRFVDNRIFYLANYRYKLLVNSPKEYENVFVECFAGRDDSNDQDPIIIKTVKLPMKPRQTVNGTKVGPLTIKQGHNELFIEFLNDELMAVTPQFSMEVHSAK